MHVRAGFSYSADVHMHDYYSYGAWDGSVSDVAWVVQMFCWLAGIGALIRKKKKKKNCVALTTFNWGSISQVQHGSKT